MTSEHRDLQPLSVTMCPSCARGFWYPRVICGRCGESTLVESGFFDGLVYSKTEVWRSKPDWRSALPFTVALVACESGFRILTQCEAVEIGDSVVVGQRFVEDFGLIPFSERSSE